METDRERGDYLDPNAGKVRLDELGPRWLGSRSVDPATMVTYEGKWRVHVQPAFGGRQVKSIRPSEIAQWVTELGNTSSPALAHLAFQVLSGCLELAVADGLIKHNPAKSKIVRLPTIVRPNVVVWADET
ncbi:phage integrase central domain-containing protein, partial [Micrococcus luteus]|uniref:phage integrase central domain-containing protein n=1 Tax=Micrococcus luteus TaxID=1270 RepID=UPI0034943B76